MGKQLDVANIEAAAALIDPVFRATPQVRDAALARRIGHELILKLEMFNPIRSFKGRGADFYMRDVAPGTQVVCASAGNFGQAVAYTGRARGVDVTVFCARNANPAKVARIRELGARVTLTGDDFDAAKAAARAYADEHDGRLFVEDGADPRISEGAGTIAVELASLKPDVLLVPVGNGALINGIGCWIKARSPRTTVVGVCAEGAPAMADSWKRGEPVSTESVNTFADGVAVRVPVPVAVDAMREFVDDVVLVDDEGIRQALRMIRDAMGLILEPSGAIGIAAAARLDLSGDTVATIVTGNNYSDDLLAELTTEPQAPGPR